MATVLLLLLTWILSLPADRAAAQDAMKTADFKQAVANARAAMSERDMAEAQTQLAKADKCAQTPDEQQELTRLEELLDYQKQFWQLLREGAAKLQSGEELVLKTTRVAVVEASRDEVVVKAEGRLYHFPIEELPTSLVLVIAGRSLAKEATSKVALGAFLLLDKKGDRAAAAKLWREAAKAGVDMDHLMPELRIEPGGGGGQMSVPTDAAKLQQAEAAVRAAFRAQYLAANTPPAQEELARKLLAAAPTVSDPESRFATFREASRLAIEAGNPALACDAIDATGKVFAIDALAVKLAALEEIGKNARRVTGQKEIVEAVVKLIKEATEAGRLDEATRLAEVGLAAAQKARNRSLMQQVSTAAQEIETLRKKATGS